MSGSGSPIRTFIAIKLPPEIKTELEQVSLQLAACLPKQAVRWVKPAQMHLTLRFLGDTAVSQIPAISHALAEAVNSHAPFTLQLNQVGCFPNQKRPRVIWVGMQGDEALQSLKRGIDRALAPLGWPVETKKFQAHLTVGRVKDGRQLTNIPWEVNIDQLTFEVSAVVLIESQLTPQGPIYTICHQAKLR